MNDRTFVGANSHISFEELSSQAGNESLSGLRPPVSLYSGNLLADSSKELMEQNRKVDEMLATRHGRQHGIAGQQFGKKVPTIQVPAGVQVPLNPQER